MHWEDAAAEEDACRLDAGLGGRGKQERRKTSWHRGQTLVINDSDKRGNAILDMVEFGQQEEDSAIGRLPNGAGEFEKVTMTPGEKNKP